MTTEKPDPAMVERARAYLCEGCANGEPRSMQIVGEPGIYTWEHWTHRIGVCLAKDKEALPLAALLSKVWAEARAQGLEEAARRVKEIEFELVKHQRLERQEYERGYREALAEAGRHLDEEAKRHTCPTGDTCVRCRVLFYAASEVRSRVMLLHPDSCEHGVRLKNHCERCALIAGGLLREDYDGPAKPEPAR